MLVTGATGVYLVIQKYSVLSIKIVNIYTLKCVNLITDMTALRCWFITLPFISPFIAASGQYVNRFLGPRNPIDSVRHLSLRRRVPAFNSLYITVMLEEKCRYVMVLENNAPRRGFPMSGVVWYLSFSLFPSKQLETYDWVNYFIKI